MTIVSVLYPKSSTSHFDHDYYTQKHIPLVQARWTEMGLERVELMRGETTLDGASPSYELIGLLSFGSAEQVQAALAKFGAEIVGDIPNFTNVEPMIQLNSLVQDQ
ncbi:MAG: EthD family reductase [Granulicella sp.]